MHFDPQQLAQGVAPRMKKVLAIRKALDAGTYHSDTEKLVTALLKAQILTCRNASTEQPLTPTQKTGRANDFVPRWHSDFN